MSAIGFGMNVTGGGKKPEPPIEVTKGGNEGPGTLAAAIQKANEAKAGSQMEIVIQTHISANKKDLVVRAQNLTIRAVGGAVITHNHLVFDCRKADNILLQDLRFEPGESRPNRKNPPRDAISIDGTQGRGKKGFWIDHCFFEAFFDLSVTANTKDLKGAPPLLLTVSYCHFHDNDPGGNENSKDDDTTVNHGSLGIHGAGSKNNPKDVDQETNAYATVCRNFFDHVRRRSPRSSNQTFVHAFNNVLEKWGSPNAIDDPKQANGMSAGHFGILAAEANYFYADSFKPTIEISERKGEAPRLLVGTGDLVNQYRNKALSAENFGKPPIDIRQEYRDGLNDKKAEIPHRDPMTDALSETIKKEAGAR
ncbi:MAG: pectate lyase [Acidobacteriota bacterium]|nr:pectate lyase [Acidobacteriota bacterium]